MIFDLILVDNKLLLTIHNKFIFNESFPLIVFQGNSPFMKNYLDYGAFEIAGPTFGLGGCFQKTHESDDYRHYSYCLDLPIKPSSVRAMLNTVYLSTNLAVSQMYHANEFLTEGVWADQSLGTIIIDGENMSYDIGGDIYPWFKMKLNGLDTEKLSAINQYVSSELDRINNCIAGTDMYFKEVNIKNNYFFITVSTNGRYVEYILSHDLDKLDRYDSHKIDNGTDQFMCFIAIVAMNTWLRNN